MNGRLALPTADIALIAAGFAASALLFLFVEQYGATVGLGLTVGPVLFLAAVAAFVSAPHVAVAATIPLFAVLPTLRVFVDPRVGGVKDVVALAALTAAVAIFVQHRAARVPSRLDTPTIVLVGLLVLLYVANVGGQLSGESEHGLAWFHGVRLFAEPLCLLLVGLTLAEPRRTLRWAIVSLVVTGCAVAAYGLVQQALGLERLMDLGYDYGTEVRTIGDHVRSFGTLNEPFAYAAFLLFCLAATLLWLRPGLLTLVALPILVVGLTASLVRTAAVVAVAILGLSLARYGHRRFAVACVLAALLAGGIVFFVGSQGQASSTQRIRIDSTRVITLNGRTNIWKSELGTSPSSWAFGRGVGATGTASQRAGASFTGERTDRDARGGVVDSSYFSTVADVGLIGLGVLLALVLRLFLLARRAAGRGARAGWLAAGILTVLLLDALTRESLNGFPTAYVAMLLVGLACSAGLEGDDGSARRSRARAA